MKRLDLVGMRVGRLSVVSLSHVKKYTYWDCVCDCGAKTIVSSGNLSRTRSCGCVARQDLRGRLFGSLTVKQDSGRRGSQNQTIWKCVCECGEIREVLGSSLVSGHTKTCGCSRRQQFSMKREYKRLYNIWANMKARCLNPKTPNYFLYGGRGISVCPEWKESFKAFLDWSLAHGYSDNLQLDRTNNDGGYEPNNCRWATQLEQVNNTRSNRRLTVGSETHTMAEWERRMSLTPATICRRLKLGFTDIEAVTIPRGMKRHQFYAS